MSILLITESAELSTTFYNNFRSTMKPFKGFVYVTSLAARVLESGRPRFKSGLYIFPLIILD